MELLRYLLEYCAEIMTELVPLRGKNSFEPHPSNKLLVPLECFPASIPVIFIWESLQLVKILLTILGRFNGHAVSSDHGATLLHFVFKRLGKVDFFMICKSVSL